MATNTLNVRMKQAVRTEAEWTSDNPVLLEGEVAYSSDKNNMYKVGDGTKTWSQLSYNNASTVNGHTVNADVPSGAKFTDTVTTATTTGSGNAVTAISASNGALTVTKGTTFLTSHQDISGKADKSATVSDVAWDSTNKKLTKTINGTASDVVTAATLRSAINVADGAEVNQNAFSNVTIGSTTIAADTTTDTLTLVAGSNITLTPDATNDKVTIAATDTTYNDATTSAHGLMTAAMVTKLNGIDEGADVNQNAYSSIKIDTFPISATSTTDTFTIATGSNVLLQVDDTNKKLTINATDTTYSSKTAASGGTDVSLVTTGEKYTWNSKTSNTGTITGVSANGTSVATSGVANIPAASTSAYGVTKLSDATNSTSTDLAATANAVKKAYDHGGVTSVNGSTGAVTITVPTKVSDLTNDSGFEANQNAFSTIAVTSNGTTNNVVADTKTDTLTLVAGSNVTLTPDTTNDKVTIAASIPMAGISTLGGIKVGSGLSIAADGTLSSTGGGSGGGGVTGMTIVYSASDETIYITTTIPNGDEVSY